MSCRSASALHENDKTFISSHIRTMEPPGS